MATVAIDLEHYGDLAGAALAQAMRLDPHKIVFIGDDPDLQKRVISTGHEVEVLPKGSAVPEGTLTVTVSYSAERLFNAALNYALDQAGLDGLEFLRLWREGCFPEIRRDYPDFKGPFPDDVRHGKPSHN